MIPFQPNAMSDSAETLLTHEGFYEALMATVEDIRKHVLCPLTDSVERKRIMIVGHSLGGAVATGALAFVLRNFNIAASPHQILHVTAGQPRFGDARFAKWLDGQICHLGSLGKCWSARIVSDRDSVPTVPPRKSGFSHCGKLCLLTSKGDLLIEPQIDQELEDTSIVEFIDEHSTDRYLHLLEAVKAEQLHEV